jgi:glycosyltransferase involved in cell wall biosynthesis
MGYSADSEDPADFEDLLCRLLSDSDKRKEMGDYNRQYAGKRFSASRVQYGWNDFTPRQPHVGRLVDHQQEC